MDAARLGLTGFRVWMLPLLFVALFEQSVSAQQGWGDQSFDSSLSANVNRSWINGGWPGNGNINGNRNWYLGVTGTNTDTGVVVQQVAPNSPAARSNIETGDVIVCVGGEQVGRVGNQIFDLAEQTNQRADSMGRVALLVLTRRFGQLSQLNIQLDNQRSGLRGSLTVQGGRPPVDSIVTIRLENKSRPAYQVRNGETSFRLDSFGVGNIPFELNYDPAYIVNTDTYVLRAFVTSSDGRITYRVSNPPFVLTNGSPSNVNLVLSPVVFSTGGSFVQVGYVPSGIYQQNIDAIYRRILGRSPTPMELAALNQMPDIAEQVQRLPVNLMATDEFYTRVGGDSRRWIGVTFQEFVGHAPSSTEMDLWLRRFGELRYSRTALLNQLAMQARG